MRIFKSSLSPNQMSFGCVKMTTVLSYGGVCIGQVRLGQVHSANYCVPPYTIMVSIPLG